MRLMDFDRWARQHHGVITRDASGLSPGVWRRAIRSGHLEQLHPLVARLPGSPSTPEQRILAAVLAAGEGAQASHRSSALLWDIERPASDPVDVLIPRHRAHLTLEGVEIHRPRARTDLGRSMRRGIACTNPLRMLCDLAAVDPDRISDAVGAILGARLASLEAIESVAARQSRSGRPGIPALRAAIDDWAIDQRPSDSELEQAMADLAERHDLPPMTFHPRLGRWEPDFRVIGSVVLIECDGWTAHGLDRGQFERDRRKDLELTAAGWIVVRLTYRAIRREAKRTAERIRAAVDRWRALPPPDASDALRGG